MIYFAAIFSGSFANGVSSVEHHLERCAQPVGIHVVDDVIGAALEGCEP